MGAMYCRYFCTFSRYRRLKDTDTKTNQTALIGVVQDCTLTLLVWYMELAGIFT